MLYLEAKANLIITDSGGIQEEAICFQTPVVVMRDNTERPEGVEQGLAILAGTSTKGIINATRHYLNDLILINKYNKKQNPYGDGRTSNRILSILNNIKISEFTR